MTRTDAWFQLSYCMHVSRRIPYTEFRVVNHSTMDISQTDTWIDAPASLIYHLVSCFLSKSLAALRQSLNRNGFIWRNDLNQNMIVITVLQQVQDVRGNIKTQERREI
ncbi:hypothetical protein PENTCL1PPCAC_12234 [Pristionchus entomophagus]|uniref:Uncharacterized protein n=1 Tax=Pristionchus entomophagus TaxID=358040 RepID=A0AAV5T8M7_9BILA|nr:hypothetical protein PENTCL1PPCAC_12234 [Pristionchus entomophagus]